MEIDKKENEVNKTNLPEYSLPSNNPFVVPNDPGFPQFELQANTTVNQNDPSPGQPNVNEYAALPTQHVIPTHAPPLYSADTGTQANVPTDVPVDPPITTQPGQIQWMPPPTEPIPNCPPGLEYLQAIDQLLVRQQIEIVKVLTGYETANKFRVFNTLGQSVYFAIEESGALSRQCFSSLRMFDMKILDNLGNEVIHIFRPFRCDNCFYPCFLQKMEITSPVGEVVGYVTQNWTFCKPLFQIENAQGECVLKIIGPYCTAGCFGEVIFNVVSVDEITYLGTIRKQWSGLLTETFTDADSFGISFPVTLDVRMKAVILGACFLINFIFYEKSRFRRWCC